MRRVPTVLLVVAVLAGPIGARAQHQKRRSADPTNRVLRIAVAGSEPFVVRNEDGFDGIAVEIWQAVAERAGWRYEANRFDNVPHALEALQRGDVDVVVGPVTITAERAESCRFSQPYYQSSLSIVSRSTRPAFWQRIAPFFSSSFYTALGVLLMVLAVVGAVIWLAERNAQAHFPNDPLHGIASGIWFAIVTMSTVGYGDLAPRTILGRLVTGIWIIISVIAATSLVAGIASTLTLTGMSTETISSAQQLIHRRVAVVSNSPGEDFAQRYGANVRGVATLEEAFNILKAQAVDALIFDRPQLLYFLKNSNDRGLVVSKSEYLPQQYGFAFALDSPLVHTMNVNLLQLKESGRVERTAQSWLGMGND